MHVPATSADAGPQKRSWTRPNNHRKNQPNLIELLREFWGFISGLKAIQGLSGWWRIEHHYEHSNDSMSSLNVIVGTFGAQDFSEGVMIEAGWYCSSWPSESS